jgi:hypothetical protein
LVEIVECSRPAAGFFTAVAAQVGPIPEALLPVVKLLLLAGVLGSATTMVAMEYFLFSFDDSSAREKVFWFCVILSRYSDPLSTVSLSTRTLMYSKATMPNV